MAEIEIEVEIQSFIEAEISLGGAASPVTIRNAETLETIEVLTGGTYDVFVFSGIIDNGPPYSNSIIDTP